MKNVLVLLLLISSLLISTFCNYHQIKNNNVDFSFDTGWNNNSAFSIKIDSSGKAFLARNRSDRQYFEKQLTSVELYNLALYIDSFKMQTFKSKYIEDIADLESFCIVLNLEGVEQIFYIYGDSAPKELYHFSDFMLKFRDDSTFSSIDSIIQFKSSSSVWKQIPPISIRK